jgi:hypothetical protein
MLLLFLYGVLTTKFILALNMTPQLYSCHNCERKRSEKCNDGEDSEDEDSEGESNEEDETGDHGDNGKENEDNESSEDNTDERDSQELQSDAIKTVLDLYNRAGNVDYIGEPISQKEHATQAALQALKATKEHPELFSDTEYDQLSKETNTCNEHTDEQSEGESEGEKGKGRTE